MEQFIKQWGRSQSPCAAWEKNLRRSSTLRILIITFRSMNLGKKKKKVYSKPIPELASKHLWSTSMVYQPALAPFWYRMWCTDTFTYSGINRLRC